MVEFGNCLLTSWNCGSFPELCPACEWTQQSHGEFFFNFLDRPSLKDYISVFVLSDSHFSWIFEILLALNSELLFRTERGVMEGTWDLDSMS